MKIPILVALAASAVLISACGDDPFLVRWQENPQQAFLYALDAEDPSRHLFLPSAFNMRERRAVVVEAAAAQRDWDFAVGIEDAEMVFLPARVLGVISNPGIAAFPDTRFEDVREAPADTARFVTRAPVPVELGTVYVVRTHQQPGSFGQSCVYYGKLEPLEIDIEAGVLRFLHDTSPDCNNRSLVPPR